MRTFLVLVVFFVLLMETLHATVPKPRLTVNRRLLSDGNFGGKTDTDGGNTKNSPASNGTGNTETEPGKDDDQDNINPSYGSYGNPAGSTSGSHHDFSSDHRPLGREPVKPSD
ncbi:hypothetical protein L6164_013683 [Bauhinia variegata]|uniref:Uncharacterized protein n=1 Tax=Bauhinia variegata TaxID=167791 RepID=A0ACB9NEU2_BAUVA|nr:hypothetical protein L6164_013683 [Bauhinia variegata]